MILHTKIENYYTKNFIKQFPNIRQKVLKVKKIH